MELESNTLDLCFGEKILHIWRTQRRKKKEFFAGGFGFAGKEFLHCPNANTNNFPNSTRNKEKQKTLAQTKQGTRKNKRKKKTLAQIEQGTRKNKRK